MNTGYLIRKKKSVIVKNNRPIMSYAKYDGTDIIYNNKEEL